MVYFVVRRSFGKNFAASAVMRSTPLFRVGMVRSCRSLSAEAGRLSTLPDVCGQPVVTSSWKAIKGLDEAYTEVSFQHRLANILSSGFHTFVIP